MKKGTLVVAAVTLPLLVLFMMASTTGGSSNVPGTPMSNELTAEIVVKESAPPRPPPPSPGTGAPPSKPEVIGYAAKQISPTEGGSVSLPDKQAELRIPAGATDDTVTFSISILAEGEVPGISGTLIIAGQAYRLTAEDADGNPVQQFSVPLTISFRLTNEDLGEKGWEDLVVMYYDGDLGWIALETTVDPKTGIVNATFDHLTVFAVLRVDIPPVEYGAQKVVMLIGDTRYSFDHVLDKMDVAPFIEVSRTFVPVRFLAEAFGAEADWEPKDGLCEVVTVTREDATITIEIGSHTLKVERDGEESTIESDVAPFIKDGRTMLPFRVISEAFGADVDYGPKDALVKWVSFEQ